MTNMPNVREVVCSNMIYYVGTFDDGHSWSTGLCESVCIASQRLELYRRGKAVSEAAPQQASRRQLEALDQWLVGNPAADVVDRAEVVAALEEGFESPAWAWVSVQLVARIREIPAWVTGAGGARVRRGPNGPIPVDASGKASLPRGQ